MKVGIVTFTYGCNFGQRLQNYAMQETLKKYADVVYTIPQKHRDTPIKRKLKKLKGLILTPRVQLLSIKKEIKFRRFDKKYINFYDSKISEENASPKMITQLDYFVCGSDQIWSPCTDDVNKSMFLVFAPKNKRICYAPSIATPNIPSEKVNQYIDYWNGFEYLSLRESNLIDFIKKSTGKDVTLVADPTLLLSINDWIKMEVKPRIIQEKKYALFYFLGSNTKTCEIRDTLFKMDFQIIDLMNYDSIYALDPNEFLFLVHHASLVVTDSYHGTLFSMIFHTPFVVFERDDFLVDMNSRFDTLNQIFNIENRMISKITNNDLLQMDFSYIDNKMKEFKEVSMQYLDKCFHQK